MVYMLNLREIIRETRDTANQRLESIPIERIRPNVHQPRKLFQDGAIKELAASMAEYGLMQPVVVRKTGSAQYELIAGERRLRAAK